MLARRFGLTLVTLGSGAKARRDGAWRIETKAFRERLTWAVQLGAGPSPAVATLLAELAARGVNTYRETDSWEGAPCD